MEREIRELLIARFAAKRGAVALQDAENCTDYITEFVCLARQLAEHMTAEELKAYLEYDPEYNPDKD